MTDDERTQFVDRCKRLSGVCTAAQEAFEPNTAPWRWLNGTAKCYEDAAHLLGRNDMAIKFVPTEDV